jgi:hypothetical protein
VTRIHKRNERAVQPLVSIILLDWSCRERFHALDWLNQQTVPRDQYELIWVELFDRIVPKALEQCDVLMTCGQTGAYHKHSGYNAGLLESKGQIVTVCDSDAVFPPDFVESIIKSFQFSNGEPSPLVLMHYEWRTSSEYPDGLDAIEGLTAFKWQDLWPNVGACVSVRRIDAIRFGGFDEHESYRGFVCGPYDLAWRLVNAGMPEIWHDPKIALWHFAHPAPYFHPLEFSFSNLKRFFEVGHPHVDYHALTAVEAFSTGRMQPLQENPEIYKIRMSLRRIGTPYEEHYATQTGPAGFSTSQRLHFRLKLLREGAVRCSGLIVWILGRENFDCCRAFMVHVLKRSLGPERFEMLKKRLG